MWNKTLSSGSAILCLVIAVAAASVIESAALSAKERADNPPRLIDKAYCTKCHADARMLKKMKDKEGDSRFLFTRSDQKPLTACPQSHVVTPAPKW